MQQYQYNMLPAPAKDFIREVMKGNVQYADMRSFSLFNNALTTTEQTIWPEGGRYSFPAAATVMTLSSSSADDAAAGTGTRSVFITGLDANYNIISETVTLNGQTPVSTTHAYLRVNQMFGLTAGSTETNQGIIYLGTGTVTTGKPANVYAIMSADTNLTTGGVYTVPAGKSVFIMYMSVGVDANKNMLTKLRTRTSTGVRYRNAVWDVTNVTDIIPKGFGYATEKVDLEITGQMTSGTGRGTGFVILLEFIDS